MSDMSRFNNTGSRQVVKIKKSKILHNSHENNCVGWSESLFLIKLLSNYATAVFQ